MNSVKVIGIVVLVLGLLGLAYGGFSYTRSTHQAKIGPLELSVKEKETVNIPMWAGAAAVAAGVLLLVMGGKR
jgi:TRAP-type C4-dicarboxylate transport system permease small subunit